MGKQIVKKILPEYFYAVVNGSKTFELRKDEDEVQRGDVLLLREWDGEEYTGKEIHKIVKYVLRDVPQFGLMEGYCIIGF